MTRPMDYTIQKVLFFVLLAAAITLFGIAVYLTIQDPQAFLYGGNRPEVVGNDICGN